jgi:hypothetical protein
MNRRGFLSSILALGIAPAVVRASSLMPIHVIEEPAIDITTTLREYAIQWGETLVVPMHDAWNAVVEERMKLLYEMTDRGILVWEKDL